MSNTPLTDAKSNEIRRSGVDWHHSASLMSNHARILELKLRRYEEALQFAFEAIRGIEQCALLSDVHAAATKANNAITAALNDTTPSTSAKS